MDFYLPKENVVIECDGEFHYQNIINLEKLETTKCHDKMKNKYLKEHKIPLLRIPFWEKKNIEILIKDFLKL